MEYKFKNIKEIGEFMKKNYFFSLNIQGEKHIMTVQELVDNINNSTVLKIEPEITKIKLSDKNGNEVK